MVQRERFRAFIGRILKASKLRIELGAIQRAFHQEVSHNKEEYNNYFKNMEDIWNSWKELNNVDFISQFVSELGPTLFLLWLSDVFPFDFDQLKGKCPRGPSNEEALLEISYVFTREELQIIKDVLIANWINDSAEEVAQTLFIEALKSISAAFSQIIQHPFKIFTSNVDLLKENETLTIQYAGAGRVVK